MIKKRYFETINIETNEIKIGIDKYFFRLNISLINNNHDINNRKNDIVKMIFK